jgi:hypothetical protein
MTAITDSSGRCLHCNYVLRDLPVPRCPECGREFDPGDVRTINLGREITPAARWALGPASAVMSVGMFIMAAVAVWTLRMPVAGEDRSLIDGALLMGLGGVWVGWPIVRQLIAKWAGWNSEWFTAGQRSRAWVGGVILLLGVGVAVRLPRTAAFWISEPAMNRLARQMMAKRGSSPADQWLGLFQAKEIKDVPGGVSFLTTREADGMEAGYVYLPAADPRSAGWASRRYVGGGWWAWHEPEQLMLRFWHKAKSAR